MESKELAQWMERRGIGQALRAWVNNELLGRRNYSDLESLATDGAATIKVTLSSRGKLAINATETFETEVKQLEQENRDLQKTVKTQEKQIEDFTPEAEAIVPEETESVNATEKVEETSPTKRKRKPKKEPFDEWYASVANTDKPKTTPRKEGS